MVKQLRPGLTNERNQAVLQAVNFLGPEFDGKISEPIQMTDSPTGPLARLEQGDLRTGGNQMIAGRQSRGSGSNDDNPMTRHSSTCQQSPSSAWRQLDSDQPPASMATDAYQPSLSLNNQQRSVDLRDHLVDEGIRPIPHQGLVRVLRKKKDKQPVVQGEQNLRLSRRIKLEVRGLVVGNIRG
jgi:hypothetical protein